MFKFRRHVQIYIPAPANTPALTQLPIPQQSLLQDVMGKEPVYIRSIDAYSSANLTGIIAQPGLAIASPADINNGLLTLSVEATLDYKQIPLSRMNPFIPDAANYSAAVQDPFLLADMSTIDWTQSYITTIIAAPTTTAFGYVLGIGYLYKSDLDAMKAEDLDWLYV